MTDVIVSVVTFWCVGMFIRFLDLADELGFGKDVEIWSHVMFWPLWLLKGIIKCFIFFVTGDV